MRRLTANFLRAIGIDPYSAAEEIVSAAEEFAARLRKDIDEDIALEREHAIHSVYLRLRAEPPSPDGEMLTPMQAAKRLGVSRSKVYELMKDGELDYVQVTPRKRLIAAEAIASFIRARST